MIRRFALILAALTLLALPASAAAATPPSKEPVKEVVPDATVKIKLGNLKGKRAEIFSTVPVFGTVKPWVPGQTVKVEFFLDGKELVTKKANVTKGGGNFGKFKSSVIVREDGRYTVSAKHEATDEQGGGSTVRKLWRVSFPSLRQGDCGKAVVGFKKAMREMGYIANSGSCYGGKTARGVLAYRKVNNMSRSMRSGAALVKAVYDGQGEYHVKYPGAGQHVEAPLSKQVLVFADGDKPTAIYPISSGKSSTPTVTGHYEFIRTEPGYNSHGMYYSFYFYGGYAVHGYESVPDYPASHGCLRTFIADQPEIYNRINFGEDIFIW
ncbi:MAG TPA: L,D-transpeptidase [Solirubrobacterales bacterium]|nr:L,D-transpeptidase [Solirubrobacterales bacterium]